jgi:hypothetical protein
MQPASAGGSDHSSGAQRVGPIAAIVVVLAVVAGLVFIGGGDSDPDPDAPDAPDATTGEGTDSERVGAEPEPPEGVLTLERAEEEGIEVEWPDTCDTDRGAAAVPSYFAPPCYAPFEGDNGGATSPGVTADTIRIVLYQSPDDDPIVQAIVKPSSDDTGPQAEDTIRTMLDYYETYYETYGRDVELEVYRSGAAVDDEVAARADAVTIAEEMNPFMVWGGPLLAGAPFAEELAAQGIINLALGASSPPSLYVDNAPYLLSVAMSPDQQRLHVAEYVGKRLAGAPAEHTVPPLSGEERVFGTVYLETGPGSTVTNENFEAALAEYGVEPAVAIPYADPVSLQDDAASVIARLKDEGVTSVIFFGDPLAPGTLTRVATDQEFFPEWILTGSALVDTTVYARSYDQEQWAHAFGVSALTARADPNVTGSYALYQWWNCTPPQADDSIGLLLAYPAVTYAVLAVTGPDLTPQHFTAGMFTADPTPRAITNPSLSWGDKGTWPTTDYHGVDDATEIWWDPAATGPSETRTEGQGMYQYVDGGTRYLPGEWPESPPGVFDPDGAVALYTESPAEEAYPDYPSPCE